MSRMPIDTRRRRFIRIAALGAMTAPLGLLTARAQERVEPGSEMAEQLQYAEQSPKAGQICRNCQLYAGGPGDEWAPCGVFAGQLVKGSGWCSAWVGTT